MARGIAQGEREVAAEAAGQTERPGLAPGFLFPEMMMQVYKAYSLLTEKSFEEGDAVIRGYATTVTPDRVNDVVVPDGVVFRTPDIKLLMHHDHRLPVGTVRFGKPDKKGLPFEAHLPDIKEEGVVRDRVREAIHSIRYNLISAVSIGFRALEDGIEMLKSGGIKFTKWEMIELSLTPTPAQPEAIFAAVKSLDGKPLSREAIDLIRAADSVPHGTLKLLSARDAHIRSGAVSLR